MDKNKSTTFNGADTIGTIVNNSQIYDSIEYCPYCGKSVGGIRDLNYCPYCGKVIPKTTTTPMIIYHWNLPDGTVTYPRDGIVNPITTC